MKRRISLFSYLWLLLAALCLAGAAFGGVYGAMRSYPPSPIILPKPPYYFHIEPKRFYGIVLERGLLRLAYVKIKPADQRERLWKVGILRDNASCYRIYYYYGQTNLWSDLSNGALDGGISRWSNGYGFWFKREYYPAGAWPDDPREFAIQVQVPFWAIGVLCAIWLTLAARPFWRRWRGSRRLARGLCPACGYDLRAHKAGEKCPECGAAVVDVAGSSSA